MFKWLFSKKSKGQLGIDLGASAIKIVELTKTKERLQLTNYVLAQPENEAIRIGELPEKEIAGILRNLMQEAQLESRLASVSLPVGRTFSTIMEMPFMSEEELGSAIPFEAQKYVPVPLVEVVLDWSVIPASESSAVASRAAAGLKPTNLDLTQKVSAAVATEAGLGQISPVAREKPGVMQVLLVAAPKEIINQLIQITKMAGLEISALEQEAFSLSRSLVGNDQGTYLIADIGRQSTDLIVVDQALVRITHNLDTINQETVLMEIERVVASYQMRYNQKVAQCLVTGGRAADEGLVKFLTEKLKIPVKVGDPFARLSYVSELTPLIKNLGPKLAVAIGLAMRE